MDKLWAPWRMDYISTSKEKGCVFCNKSKSKEVQKSLILYKAKKCFVLMNLYPYTNGHLMISPFKHTSDTNDLSNECNLEIMVLANECFRILKKNLKAEGFNFGLNLGNVGIVGLSMTSLSTPEDLVRTVEKPNGTGEYFDANDLAINLSYARRLTNKFSLGGNIKYIRQSIWHANANSVAADLGALFITPFNEIRLGASLSNYGSDMQMTGRNQKFSVDPDPINEGNVEFVNAIYETDKFPLPLIFRVGLSGEIINTDFSRLTFAIDALHPNDNVEWVNFGLEFASRDMFFLRGGMSTLFRENSEEGLTLGSGFNYRLPGSSTQIKLDYSYSEFGKLRDVQRLSIGIHF